MENQPIFRKTAFGGFEKKSVLDYIYELNASTQEATAKLNAQLGEVTASREKLSDSVREMESRLEAAQRDRDSVANELSSEKSRTRELSAMIDSLGEEIKKQEQIIVQKEEEIAEHLQRCEELVEKNQILESKQEEVTRASTYIGELLLRTRSDSEQILAEASQKADKMVEEAARSMEDVHTQFERFSADMAVIQTQIQATVTSIQDKFSHITGSVGAAERALRDICYPQTGLRIVGEEAGHPNQETDSDDGSFFRSAADR